jgi:4-hydroxy-tetrahydrodipicolinate synthase
MALYPSPLPQVLCPVVTPFDSNGIAVKEKLAQHCAWLQKNRVGLAVFGTNSEANSMSVGERVDILQFLANAGLNPDQMMPGTGACAVPDAVTLSQAAVNAGCAGVLMLPPFYYKDVSDDGLFAYYSKVIEGVGSDRLKVYVYNIPPITKVGLSLNLLERLVKAYPNTVVGIKDSSGDWSYTESVLKALAPAGFRVYAGSESFLLRTMQLGGAGCISATTNVNPKAIADLAANWQSADAEAQQTALDAIRMIFQTRPMIPAMKAAIAHFSKDAQWAAVRPPLVSLNPEQTKSLIDALRQANFTMEF